MTPETPKEISVLLAREAERVCQHLWPNGKREGREWRVGDVFGAAGHSLACELSGSKAGTWCDFANKEVHKGDLLDGWRFRFGIDLGQALREAKTFLGITTPTFTGKRPKAFKPCTRPKKAKLITKDPEQSPVVAYLKGRGITEATLKAFHVMEQPNSFQDPENPADIVFPYLVNDPSTKTGLRLVNNKYLALRRIPQADGTEKKNTRLETGCPLILFGWHLIPPDARKVLLVEGEADCLTWHQIGAPSLSVPNGATSHTWLENDLDHLARFDEIFLSFDDDAAGKEGLAILIERLGRHRCRIVKLPHKDANAGLQAGMQPADFLDCLRRAQAVPPDEFITFREGIELVKERRRKRAARNGVPDGIQLPWPKAHGFYVVPEHLTVWSGYGGHGKTTLISHVLACALRHTDERIGIASLEMNVEDTLERLCTQVAGRSTLSDAEFDVLGTAIDDRCVVYHHVGSSTVAKTLEVFLYARRRHGITQFVVDSLMMLGIGHEDYDGQLAASQKMTAFAKEHRVHIHLVIHPRKPTDENKIPGMYDVKGSGGLADGAHNVIMVWRNKKKQRAQQDALANGVPLDPKLAAEPDTVLNIEKNRFNGWLATIPLWFHADSQQFLERSIDYPVIYIQPNVTPGAPF